MQDWCDSKDLYDLKDWCYLKNVLKDLEKKCILKEWCDLKDLKDWCDLKDCCSWKDWHGLMKLKDSVIH